MLLPMLKGRGGKEWARHELNLQMKTEGKLKGPSAPGAALGAGSYCPVLTMTFVLVNREPVLIGQPGH